jgi:hypothetical protein
MIQVAFRRGSVFCIGYMNYNTFLAVKIIRLTISVLGKL